MIGPDGEPWTLETFAAGVETTGVWSIVQLGELQGEARLDAEFWQPKYLQTEQAITAHQWKSLDDLATSIRKGIFYILANEYTETGIPFYRSSNVGEIVPSEHNLVYISSEKNREESKTALQYGDVMLAKTGQERASVVLKECNISQDVIGIRLHKASVDPFYLVTYLNTRIGKLQMLRWFQGQVQPHLSLPGAKRVLVPLPSNDFQSQVAVSVRQSNDLVKQSKVLYTEAESLLLAELGLDALDLSHQTTYTQRAGQVWAAGRLDAEHFQPKYQRVLDALQTLNPQQMLPLNDMLAMITNGQTPLRHNLSIGEIPFITAEFVSDFRIDYGSNKRILRKHHEGKLQRTALREGDVLVTIKGRIGNAAVVTNLPCDVNINQDVALLRLKEGYHPYYVAAFINSQAGKALTKQICTGQINPFLGLGNLNKVLVPIFETERMNQLGDRVRECVESAYHAEQEAKRLLEQAKRRVEEMVLGA